VVVLGERVAKRFEFIRWCTRAQNTHRHTQRRVGTQRDVWVACRLGLRRIQYSQGVYRWGVCRVQGRSVKKRDVERV